MSKPYSELYRAVCLDMQTTVEQRIGRVLDQEELLGIWNAGSLMNLESIDRTLAHTESDADLPVILQRNALAFRDRFASAVAQASSLVEQHKAWALLHRHKPQLAMAQNIYDVMKIAEQYAQDR